MAEANSRTPREETTLERADRNFGELRQELRIIQTGVQILFAFLLTLAFTARFPMLDTAQRTMYITTLLVCGGLWVVLPQFVRRHAARFEARAVSEPPAGPD
ncbi:DUF6328 family protein [Streptomyces sp. NPDC060065]|uniref:DUF6328 family protein n=1 Tax=Streptomyces sp. NPDC060065 TaxID=3347050 RepID=UPI0036C2C415